jgi:hypothetical protein
MAKEGANAVRWDIPSAWPAPYTRVAYMGQVLWDR